MRRPLLIPALCVAAGIWSAELFPGDFGGVSLTVALLGLALAGLWSKGFAAGISLALFGVGALSYQTTQWPLGPDDLRWRLDGHGELGRVRGSWPRRHQCGFQSAKDSGWNEPWFGFRSLGGAPKTNLGNRLRGR